MSQNDVNCILCGTDNVEILYELKDWYMGATQRTFKSVKCKSCGLVYLYPKPVYYEIEKFYSAKYYFHPSYFLEKIRNMRLKSVARKLITFVFKKSNNSKGDIRILDIGCGNGDFLEIFREEFGVETFGVEPNRYAYEIAKEKKIKMYYSLDEIKLLEYFDIIILKHVIEHLFNPKETLLKIFSLLKKDGILYLELPIQNKIFLRIFKKYWHGYDCPRHLYVFSIETIKKILSFTGFIPIVLSYDLAPNDWIISLRNYLIDKKFNKTIIKFFSENNILLMFIFYILNLLLYNFYKTDRIKIIARKYKYVQY